MMLAIGMAMGLVALGLVTVPAVHATTPCAAFSTTNTAGDTYMVSVTGADGSCPVPSFDGTGRAHVSLGYSHPANPYTIVLVSCSASDCPPTQVWVGGWGPGNVGSPTYTLPFSFTLDGSTPESCGTAPIKVAGTSGQSIVQIEGTDCPPSTTTTTTTSSTTQGVPEFGFGLLGVLSLGLPVLILLRRKLVP